MKNKFLSLLIVCAILFSNVNLRAGNDDEGMWLPLLVQKLNIKKMQAMGLKLTAEDIYSVNKSSLKDAVIALDHGSCTGELISKDGLFLTNHHCGYGEIQAHSSVEHDYLTNGFWTKKRKGELANPEKTVSFLKSVKDVTAEINAKLTADMTEDERANMIRKISKELEEKAMEKAKKEGKDWYEAEVSTFFKGNDFYLFVYETFKDVRLVFAPPSSIGKFGADTDNWMWPRHTGDFSMFRIYCDKDGKPAEYSEKNVPYHPNHFFPISIKGVEKDDFAMVMGYPGTTTRYKTSWEVQQTIDNENSIRIKLRGQKQEIMKKDMNSSDKIRIQYASKYSRSTNYYKYSIGQNKGLKALKVVAQKKALEKQLITWINKDKARKEEYAEALDLIKNATKNNDKYDIISNYWFEALYRGAEVLGFAWKNITTEGLFSKEEEAVKKLKEEGEKYFKDYNQPTDKAVFVKMMQTYKADIDPEFHPEFFQTVKKDYNGDFNKYADDLYSKSVFTDKERYLKFLDNPELSVLKNDPAVIVAKTSIDVYKLLAQKTAAFEADLTKGQRLFVKALREMETDKTFYPDANSTMRLTYGKVGDYSPKDAVRYKHYTTLTGYMEKEDPNNPEFVVFDKLKELYYKKDFGKYGQKNENGELEMRVCFTTNNDITGGNSGSPVINGNGELIGAAFDGNWEAMSGDIAFEPRLQKCINVDIRFVLFIVDKYAGAKHLIKEMEIVD